MYRYFYLFLILFLIANILFKICNSFNVNVIAQFDVSSQMC